MVLPANATTRAADRMPIVGVRFHEFTENLLWGYYSNSGAPVDKLDLQPVRALCSRHEACSRQRAWAAGTRRSVMSTLSTGELYIGRAEAASAARTCRSRRRKCG